MSHIPGAQLSGRPCSTAWSRLRRPRGDREFDSKAKLSRRELGTSNLNHIDAEIDGVSMPDPGILLADEVGRLAAVRRYDILDTPPDGSSGRCSRVGAA